MSAKKKDMSVKTIFGAVLRQDPIRGNQGAGGDRYTAHQLEQKPALLPPPVCGALGVIGDGLM